MGTKFANLQVQGLSEAEVQELLPNSYSIQLINGWTTLVREDFQIELIDQVARKLSKKIESPVISVGYYDDDILTLNILRNGKSVAAHISNNAHGYDKKEGNPSKFVKELGLPIEYKEYFKWIFKCESPDRQVALLEKLLGIPLSLNSESIKDFNENECSIDISYIKHYSVNMKKSQKVKNITKANLLFEMEGHSLSANRDFMLINIPNNKGGFYVDHAKLYNVRPDGSIIPFISKNPIRFNDNGIILLNDKLIAIQSFISKNTGEIECSYSSSITTFSMHGDKIDSFTSDEIGRANLLLTDGIITYFANEKIIKYHISGSKLWDLPVGYLYTNTMYHNDFIFLHNQNNNSNSSEILKINQDGNVEVRLELPRVSCQWRKFLFDKSGNFYYSYRELSEKDNKAYLFCYNDNLEKIAEFELPTTCFEGLIDLENNRIYLDIFEREIMVVDINSFQIISRKNYDGDIQFLSIDNNGRLYIQKGASTIEILDMNLNIVSRHRFKGDINNFYTHSDNKVRVITSNFGSYFNSGKPEKCMLWVYDIV